MVAKTFIGKARQDVTGDGRKNPSTVAKKANFVRKPNFSKRKKIR